MYARTLSKADQTRRFVIVDNGGAGWEIREEEAGRVLKRVHYTDWHRVERARLGFMRQVVQLRDAGWVELT